MDPVTQAALLSAVRALMIIVGTVAASLGHHVADQTLSEVGGALTVLIAFGWSIWDKYRAEKATQVREVVAVKAGIAAADSVPGPTPAIAPEEVPAIIQAFSQPPGATP